MNSIDIATPFVQFPGVGRCIYCRRKALPLTKEHLMPFGLASDSLVMFKASCRKCQDKSREFETVCLRHMWWPFRTKLLIPSRGKQGRPETFRLRRARMTSPGVIPLQPDKVDDLSADEFPLYYYAFTFPPPAVLTGRAARDDGEGGYVLCDQEAFSKFAEGGNVVRLGSGNYVPFAQMIAKIAHGYAVSQIGIDSFRAVLPPGIRDKSPIRWMNWISSDDPPAVSELCLHQIALRLIEVGARRYASVQIRLFACLATPRYTVIVGELEPSFDQLSLFEKPVHEILIKSPLPVGKLTPLRDVVDATRPEMPPGA